MNSSKKDITVADTLPAASDVAMRNDKKFVRSGGGSVWVDETLCEWPENDYRLFIGDISKEVTDEAVAKHFKALYKSFVKARVVHSKKEIKGRGYAFVSFLDPLECAKALREQNGKYLCNRPMRISRADWKTHDIKEVRKKEQQKRKFGLI
jgi:RNA recognition motif-containing protein